MNDFLYSFGPFVIHFIVTEYFGLYLDSWLFWLTFIMTLLYVFLAPRPLTLRKQVKKDENS